MARKQSVKYGTSLLVLSLLILFIQLETKESNEVSLSKNAPLKTNLKEETRQQLTENVPQINYSCRALKNIINERIKSEDFTTHWKNFYYFNNKVEFNLRMERESSHSILSLYKLDKDGLPTKMWDKKVLDKNKMNSVLATKSIVATNSTVSIDNETKIIRLNNGQIQEVEDLASNQKCYY